jgi:hypothetical protein
LPRKRDVLCEAQEDTATRRNVRTSMLIPLFPISA